MKTFYVKGSSPIGIVFLTIVFLGFCVEVAHAYDQITCNGIFASANVEKVEAFKVNGGDVDFGDDLHLVGSPQGDAVVCWSIDGRVAVKGKLYSDNSRDHQTARVEIRFRRTNGNVTGTTWRSLTTQGGLVSSREVEKVSPEGRFKEVRIRLKAFYPNTGLGPVSRTLATKTIKRE